MARAHRRRLEHLQAYIDAGGDFDPRHRPVAPATGVSRRGIPAAEMFAHPEWQTYHREFKALILRVVPAVYRQKHPANPVGMPEGAWIGELVGGLPAKEKYELLEAVILHLKDLPQARLRTVGYVRGAAFFSQGLNFEGPPPRAPGQRPSTAESWSTLVTAFDLDPEYPKFLDRLAACLDPAIREAGTSLKPLWRSEAELKRLELARRAMSPRAPRRADPVATITPGAPEAKFTPVVLQFAPADGGAKTAAAVSQIVAAGPGVDVLTACPKSWATHAVFVMKEKGKPRRVWTGETNDQFTLHYDGRYVWAAGRTVRRNPPLLVIDPVTEQVYQVTGKHGVPEASAEQAAEFYNGLRRELVAAPLAPGRACLSGSLFGRGWVAVATFDPAAGPAVKVIHEARKVGTGGGREGDPADAEVAFKPILMTAYHDRAPDGKPLTRVLLWHLPGPRPLLIDPDRPGVKFLSHFVGINPGGLQTRGPAPADAGAYFLDTMSIWRLSGPDGTKGRVADGFPGGHWWLHYRDGVLNVIVQGTRAEPVASAKPGAAPKAKVEAVPRTEWWQLDPAAEKWSRVATDAPRVDALHVSSHYGYVIAGGAEGRTYPPGLYAVEFVPPGK